MANPNTTKEIETLAAQIADKVYLDIAKWHLRLDDAHLHVTLAEQLYPLLTESPAIEEAEVVKVLEGIPVNLGGGRRQLPLLELIPTSCQVDLMSTLEEFKREL